jgi:hypothetical protein
MTNPECTYRRIERTAFVRHEGEGGPHTHCRDRKDTSRVALGADYDSRCGHCWLGHPHTMALHNYLRGER